MLPRVLALAALALATTAGVTAQAPAAGSTSAATSVCQSSAFQALTPSPLGGSPLTVRSLVQGDQICLEFTLSGAAATSATWFAVGLAPTAAMVNSPTANVMIFQAATGKPESYYIEGYSSSGVIKETDQSFFAVQTATTKAPLSFRYQRTLAAKSPYDVTIDPTKSAQFIWAYGSSWPITGHKAGTKGSETYNFVTGASTTATEPFCERNNCPAIVGGITFAAMLVAGAIVSLVLARTGLGRVLLYKTLSQPPVKSTTNQPLASPWTMFRQNLADLRIGEFFVMLMFIAAAVILVAINHERSDSIKSGQVVLLLLMFMMLPVARIPLWSLTFGSSFERLVKFHRWLGMALAVATIVHLIVALKVTDVLRSDKYGEVVPLWGFLAFISFMLIVVTANEYMRRTFFEVFYLSHRVLSVVGFVFTILHAPKIIGVALIVPLVLYVLGLLNRWSKAFTASYQASVSVHETTYSTTLILNSTEKTQAFARDMGLCSYFWVKIPTLSGIQWHPFSAITTPQGDSVAFCIRGMGTSNSFTRQLFQHAKSSHALSLSLCGPFGKLSINVDDYDIILLIAGGVGITPLLSAINQRMLFGPKGSKAKDWNLVWSVRHKQDLLMTDALMPSHGDPILANNVQDPYQPVGDAGNNLNVSWHCHCSEEKSDGAVVRGNGELISYRGGMPVLDEYINSSRYMGRKVAVLACGPPTMTVEAQALARQCGFDFHKEVFNW